MASVVKPQTRAFLRRLCEYFGWDGVRVVETNSEGGDIACYPYRRLPTVFVGPKWRRNERRNPRLSRKQLVHEGLHTRGLDHDDYGHGLGYYSRDRRRDVLAERVMRDVERGAARFDPRRFGIDQRRLAVRPAYAHGREETR